MLQVGQQYSAAITSGISQLQQLNNSFQSINSFHQNNIPQNITQNGNLGLQQSVQAHPIIQIQPSTQNFQKHYQIQQPQPPLQPSIQVNIQPLVKPMQTLVRNQPVQPVAPIVYSFGQPDYSQKFYSNNNAKINKRLSWATGDNIEMSDDYAELLG